jgi:4-hydroxy-tetrahydrodipicolinate synthase
MYHLSREERLQLAKFVRDEVAGRVCLVASGTFGGTLEEQAAFCVEMSNYCDAVVVLTCQLAKKEESDEIWTKNAQTLLDLTGNIKLGLYECPDPYKRV